MTGSGDRLGTDGDSSRAKPGDSLPSFRLSALWAAVANCLIFWIFAVTRNETSRLSANLSKYPKSPETSRIRADEEIFKPDVLQDAGLNLD